MRITDLCICHESLTVLYSGSQETSLKSLICDIILIGTTTICHNEIFVRVCSILSKLISKPVMNICE